MNILNIFKFIKIKLMNRDKYIKYLRNFGVKIGENCEINKSANFGSEPYLISLGNHVRINSNVQLITHDGGVWIFRDSSSGYGSKYKNIDYFGQIKIGNNVHIGTGAMIMPGVTIGNNCVIGCSAVVTHDVPDNSVYAGVPAKFVKSIDEYKKKIDENGSMTKTLSYDDKKKYLMKKFRNK